MYYKSSDKELIFAMATICNTRQQALSAARGDTGTKRWAVPQQDVDGDWTLQKPDHIYCDDILEANGGCAVVDSVTLPEPDPDDTPPE